MEKKLFYATLYIMLCIVVINPQKVLAQTDSYQKNANDSIQQTILRFSDSWNIHDAKAFSMLFAEDADFSNVFAESAKGRLAIEKFHAPMFSTIFKSSTLIAENKKVRFIKPDVAAVDIAWRMTGATFPDGKPWADRKGLANVIMTPQKNGQWVIVVMHNMDLPPMPSK